MRKIDPHAPILIVGPSWVGDMVMAASLVASLQARYPERPIDMLAPPSALPIATLIDGVREAIPLGFGHGEFGFFGRWKLGRSLRKRGYGTAIILPRAFKAAIVPFAAGIPERIGYAAEGRSILLTDARADTGRKTARTIDRFVALSSSDGTPVPSPRPVLRAVGPIDAALFARLGLDPEAPALALCPGAEYGPAKRWPADKFAGLARLGHEAGYRVRLFGGPKDRPITAEIAEKAGVPLDDLAGRTSLIEAAALLAASAVVVSNDSGLMHVAGALDRPLVVLYGSSSEKLTPADGAERREPVAGAFLPPLFPAHLPARHAGLSRGHRPRRRVRGGRAREGCGGFRFPHAVSCARKPALAWRMTGSD